MPITLQETLNNIYVVALRNMNKEVQDNIYKTHPVLTRLKDRGNVKMETGGRYIERRVWNGKNTQATWLTRGGTTSLADTEFMTAVNWEWRTIAIPVLRYRKDEQQARGKAKILDLAREKIQQANEQLAEELDVALQIPQAGIAIDSLPTIISTVPGTTPATLAGITMSGNSWWENKVKASSGMADLYLLSDMRNLFYTLIAEGGGGPDLFITSQNVFEWYESQLEARHMIVDQKMADAGFQNFTYKGVPMVWSHRLDADKIYMLNTRYIFLVIERSENFVMTKWKDIPQQVEDYVAQIYATLNFITNNRRRQGVLYDITNTGGGY